MYYSLYVILTTIYIYLAPSNVTHFESETIMYKVK